MKSQSQSHVQVRTLIRLDSEKLALCPCSYTKIVQDGCGQPGRNGCLTKNKSATCWPWPLGSGTVKSECLWLQLLVPWYLLCQLELTSHGASTVPLVKFIAFQSAMTCLIKLGLI